MKYPKAGDLQRATAVQLRGNPKENPWEVTSDIGLEGVFADRDDAEFHAKELEASGARSVIVKRRERTPLQRVGHEPPTSVVEHNPARVLREKWGDSSEIVIESNRYGYSGWLESKRGGGRLPISFGAETPSNAHEAMALAKKFLRSVHGRSNPEETFDTDILGGMERTIWVTSYADWVEGLSKEERKAAGTPVSLSGIDWSDVAPPAHASALLAAEDLYLAYERVNGKTPGQLFEIAVKADGVRATDELADDFGYYLVMMALGHGVSWFDDHKEFPIKQPRSFEAHYDDGEIWWSPQIRSRQNPPGAPKLWRVWITGYPDSYVDVNATSADQAMRMGALSQRASHHGEVVEIHVRPVGELAGADYSQHVRLGQGGRFEVIR